MLYQEIQKKIIQLILERHWTPGKRLPSERSLCLRWNVSNYPVRRAIDELCKVNALRRVPGVSVEVGDGLVAQTYDLRLGFLSVGVPTYPSAEYQVILTGLLKKHHCALQVFHAERELDREVLGELSVCDFLIVSGFLNPLWIKALQALDKPTMHFGARVPDCEDPFPSVESDHVDCFSQIIRRAFHDGHRRLLVWLPNQEWHSQTKAILEGFQTARERNARLGISFILDYPDEHSLSSLREAMERNSEFDALCLRHAAFRNATMLPEWYAWLGERRGFIHTPEALPANFTQETGFQVLGVQGFEKFMLEYFFSGNECTRLAGKRLMSPPFFLS